MTIYNKTVKDFQEDLFKNVFMEIIIENYRKTYFQKPNPKELESWKNSFSFLGRILDKLTNSDLGMVIEFQIPPTNKRIDVFLTGKKFAKTIILVIELKQWEQVEFSDCTLEQSSIVKTYIGGGLREVAHPSEQASTYAFLMANNLKSIYENNYEIKSIAYLHNLDETFKNILENKMI